MKWINKKELSRLVLQLIIWLLVSTLPAIFTYVITNDLSKSKMIFNSEWHLIRNYCIIYIVNYCFFVPYFLFNKNKLGFAIGNIILIILLNLGFFEWKINVQGLKGQAFYDYMGGVLLYAFLLIVSIFAAVVMRRYYRSSDIAKTLMEEKQKNVEAELTWLKSQLNPHFFFNTLNNISGLVKIDADKAQDSIAQLSDLMRYAVYETNKQFVPIKEEIEFMANYVELMRLRLNERTKIVTTFNVNRNINVAPLLFISLIENAFKHGISSNKDSYVGIELLSDEEGIYFRCDNTNYPKDDKNRSGSGIGINNMLRRLEILYPDSYEYNHSVQTAKYNGIDIYHAEIILHI